MKILRLTQPELEVLYAILEEGIDEYYEEAFIRDTTALEMCRLKVKAALEAPHDKKETS